LTSRATSTREETPSLERALERCFSIIFSGLPGTLERIADNAVEVGRQGWFVATGQLEPTTASA
jgi:hypothetical protein